MNWNELSNPAIVKHIGLFIKHHRINQNLTQAQLAERAGLNRWTVIQMENGESVTLLSLIQLMRALSVLEAWDNFQVNEEISPIEYAKLKKKERKRVRTTPLSKNEEDLGW